MSGLMWVIDQLGTNLAEATARIAQLEAELTKARAAIVQPQETPSPISDSMTV